MIYTDHPVLLEQWN